MDDNTKFKIESGIPIPPKPRAYGRTAKYPFAEMGVGDSIYVDGGSTASGNGRRAWDASAQHGKRHGKRFTVRSVEGGVRIWRVE